MRFYARLRFAVNYIYLYGVNRTARNKERKEKIAFDQHLTLEIAEN